MCFCGWCGVAMRAPTLGAALEHACNRHSVLLCRGAFAPIARCSFSCRQPISCPQSNCLFDGDLVMRISVIGHGHKCQHAHCPPTTFKYTIEQAICVCLRGGAASGASGGPPAELSCKGRFIMPAWSIAAPQNNSTFRPTQWPIIDSSSTACVGYSHLDFMSHRPLNS